jgi:hypothetical protein
VQLLKDRYDGMPMRAGSIKKRGFPVCKKRHLLNFHVRILPLKAQAEN